MRCNLPQIDSNYLISAESKLSLDFEGLSSLYEQCLKVDMKGTEIKWKSLLNEPDIKLFQSVKGSLISKDFSLMNCEMYVEPNTSDYKQEIVKLVQAFHNPSVRASWDQQIMIMDIIKPDSGKYASHEGVVIHR